MTSELCKEKELIKIEDMQEAFNCDKKTAIEKINKFLNREIIKKIDSKNNTYYELTK